MKKAIAATLLASVMLSGCSSGTASDFSGISQAEYDKVVQERDEYKKNMKHY